MKKLIENAFLLAIGLMVLQSCDKDEDKNIEPETIVGVWQISTIDPDISINGVDITDLPPELLGLDETESLFLNLLLEPNSSSLFAGFQIQFMDDNTLAISSEEGIEEESTYIFTDDSQLIITTEGTTEEIVFNVNNLTANTMDLSLNQNIALDLDEDGTEENVNVVILANLVK